MATINPRDLQLLMRLLQGEASDAPIPARAEPGRSIIDFSRRGTANFMRPGGQFGTPGGADFESQYLTTVESPTGAKFRVHKDAAPYFSGFLNELHASGYSIDPKQSGGYNYRQKRGGKSLSQHAFGNAIDINWSANPWQPGAAKTGNMQHNLPADVSDMAAKWGLSWGGDWKSVKDPMHFEWTGNKPDIKAPPQSPSAPLLNASAPQQAPVPTALTSRPAPNPLPLPTAPMGQAMASNTLTPPLPQPKPVQPGFDWQGTMAGMGGLLQALGGGQQQQDNSADDDLAEAERRRLLWSQSFDWI